MAESNPLTKFQSLLQELFQFDCSDLDFGIYRIMNYKRGVIQRFIEKDLPNAVAEELRQGVLAEQAQAQEALVSARDILLKTLGDNALDADGNLGEQFKNTPAGKAYLKAQAKAKASRSTEALEATIYNHLYTFFSRYWQDGDFISRRRYSKKERYAIPYNGEEVMLYWANHDQYYIKTGEYFTDYTYQASNGVTVHFKLKQVDLEQNNVKAEKRFFLPLLDGISWDETSRTLIVPFEFRPLTEQEIIIYGQKNQQETIISKAVIDIPKRIKAIEVLAALTAERQKREDGTPVSLLEHHLRQYTRRNTSDFFIHKDLMGFLSRELDFYLKNEVLNLDEIENAGESLSEGWFQLMRIIKRIGLRIIEFLAQIEEFQKMLWEKKKFVTETFYMITIGNIPEVFYPEIVACDAQWEEWKLFLSLNELPPDILAGDFRTPEGRLTFLKNHSTLPLDTRHFSKDFTDRLLASFDNIDDLVDGLLVHSENWQALNLLKEKYREQIKCIYIDPPYNTGSDEFLYRDNYKHSSWLAMMENRLEASKFLFTKDIIMFISIDDNEQRRLKMLLEHCMGEQNLIATIPVVTNLKGNQDEFGFAGTHEYAEVSIFSRADARFGNFPLQDEEELEDWEEDEHGYYKRGANLKATGINAPRSKRPNLFYPIYITQNGEISISRTSPADIEILPITGGEEMSWRWSKDKLEREKHNVIVVREGNTISLYKKQRPSIGDMPSSKPKSIFYKPEYSSGNGTAQIRALFGSKVYSYPKPVELIKDYLLAGNARSWTLDFFAGSGTTGHAVIGLNREDGGQRKFILVEMARYFDTVLLPRIKKVTFTPEWKDGKPKRMATPEEAARSPRVVKVIRLESYEDSLNNLTFDEEGGQKALAMFMDEYLLNYMLRWETRKSETMLDIEKLQSPLSYRLRIYHDGEIKERPVDLPETFAYLIGMDVKTRRVYENYGKHYMVYRGTLRNGKTIVVIWREVKDWSEEDYRRELEFISNQKITDGAEEIYVNGDSIIPGAQSLDPIFKHRMFMGVEG
ncbi:MAG: site-specific DNA-methyltransferase [Candidatus Aminicenantes bacterium]|nr:site-specific DNA-methyltransferase [Candidatus Aminicenantes bacterium]